MFLWAYNNNNNNKKSTHFAVYFVWVIAADTCVCVCVCVLPGYACVWVGKNFQLARLKIETLCGNNNFLGMGAPRGRRRRQAGERHI